MGNVKDYDLYGNPIYDVSELEEYVYEGSSKKKLYKTPDGGLCDEDGWRLGMLDLLSLGISLAPENPEPSVGLNESEIEAQLKETTDELQLKILGFRQECNSSLRGDSSSIMDPLFGDLTNIGKIWAEDLGEENVRNYYNEQKALFDQYPSAVELEQCLLDLFGVDYAFHATKKGDVYIVNMLEDTGECLQFMLRSKGIFILLNEDEEYEETELEKILRSEIDSIKELVYKKHLQKNNN